MPERLHKYRVSYNAVIAADQAMREEQDDASPGFRQEIQNLRENLERAWMQGQGGVTKRVIMLTREQAASIREYLMPEVAL